MRVASPTQPSRVPWEDDNAPDPSRVSDALGAALPEAGPWHAELMAAGWDHFVFRACSGRDGRTYAARVPRRECGVVGLRRELAFLRHVAPVLGTLSSVSTPKYFGGVHFARQLPIGFGVYEMIEGGMWAAGGQDGAESEGIARDIGRFLASLHSIGPARKGWMCPRALSLAWREALKLSQLEVGISRARWCTRVLRRLDARDWGRAVVCHGDLDSCNAIVDSDARRLVGVIDWTWAGTDVRGADFAGVRAQMGESALCAALEAYGARSTARLATYARTRAVFCLLESVAWDASRGDRGAVERSIEAIDELLTYLSSGQRLR